MHVTFITPHVGRKDIGKANYVRTWQMEPLPIATLIGLTPEWIGVAYFDERIEQIDFDQATDLVCITVETYTAKRAYEIAAAYHARGVKTLLGGYHVMLRPDEAMQYADSILVGFAEPVLADIFEDAKAGQLQRRYQTSPTQPYAFGMPRRDLFTPNSYLPLACVETGRGCPLHCNFCSIAVATQSRYVARPIDLVLEELAGLKTRNVFFVDDNFVGNIPHAMELCGALSQMDSGINWVGQGTLNMAKRPDLLEAMAGSGCMGMLIGFESLRHDTLQLMDKGFNAKMGDYRELVKIIHSYGIGLYGTFIFGYASENEQDMLRTAEEAIEMGLFIGAFNHLMPFPGTPLYAQLQAQGKLQDEAWWLSPTFRFNDVPFDPAQVTAVELREMCLKVRKRFYSFPAILRRARNFHGNLTTWRKAGMYAGINYSLWREIDQKNGLPLGNEPVRPVPLYPRE